MALWRERQWTYIRSWCLVISHDIQDTVATETKFSWKKYDQPLNNQPIINLYQSGDFSANIEKAELKQIIKIHQFIIN